MPFQSMSTRERKCMAGPLYCFSLCLALLTLSAHSQTREPAELEPLKVSIPVSAYTHVDDQGNVYGFFPSLISAISERLGRDIDIQTMPYLRGLHALKTGDIDITFGVQGVPQKGSIFLPNNIVTPTEPVLTVPISFYALTERNIQIKDLGQTKHYRIGSVRLEQKKLRAQRKVESTHYYKDAFSLSKALQANHIDLATLDPGSAHKIKQKLGVQLERVYDYSHLEFLSVFSKRSPRMKDPVTLCQNFAEARVTIFNEDRLEKLLVETNMSYLLPYYNRTTITPARCRTTTAAQKNAEVPANTSKQILSP